MNTWLKWLLIMCMYIKQFNNNLLASRSALYTERRASYSLDMQLQNSCTVPTFIRTIPMSFRSLPTKSCILHMLTIFKCTLHTKQIYILDVFFTCFPIISVQYEWPMLKLYKHTNHQVCKHFFIRVILSFHDNTVSLKDKTEVILYFPYFQQTPAKDQNQQFFQYFLTFSPCVSIGSY